MASVWRVLKFANCGSLPAIDPMIEYANVGPNASRQELEECRAKLLADPTNYISQPCIKLSVAPTLVDGRVEPRHVDLRPFAVTGSSTWILPGGLTRVALRHGSLVVNSSQGGGSKDTWVVA